MDAGAWKRRLLCSWRNRSNQRARTCIGAGGPRYRRSEATASTGAGLYIANLIDMVQPPRLLLLRFDLQSLAAAPGSHAYRHAEARRLVPIHHGGAHGIVGPDHDLAGAAFCH